MRRAAKAIFAGLLFAVAPAIAAPIGATASLSDVYNAETDRAFRVGMQMRLAWTGDYAGGFDGHIGSNGLRAIRDFQARHGMEASGVIDEAMLRLLITQSDAAESEAGFELVPDEVTGIRLGLPLAYTSDVGATGFGRVWRSDDGEVEIETFRLSDGSWTLDRLYASLRRSSATRTVSAQSFDGRFFTITGQEYGRAYVMRFAGLTSDIRGFSMSYTDNWASRMSPVVTVAANLFDPFGVAVGGPEMPDPDGLPAIVGVAGDGNAEFSGGRSLLNVGVRPNEGIGAEGGASLESSGTGFVVSQDGWILTNAHVAGSCTSVLVGTALHADKILIDEANDLALIHVAGALGPSLAISRGVPRLGEDVLALGYPLRSILADSLNVTRGNVSSLLGLMNDPRYLQISAPIQPGNSGGPLVDLAGRVVGVVTAKLNAVAIADATGDIPQSINFAIRPDAAVRFLEQHGIEFEVADADEPFASVADTTESVEASILPIVCLRAG